MSWRAALAVLVWTAGCEKAGDGRPPPAPVRSSDAAPRPAPTPADAGPADELREAARALVRQGFDPRDDMVQLLVEVYSEEGKQVSVATARRLVDEELERHREEEATWLQPTDCDKLDAAFAQLERSGIIARQDFSDCGTCGSGEMEALIDQAMRRGRKVRGYTFFHDQDTEGALDGELYLAYGAVKEGEPAFVAIGHEVARALRAEGLAVEWNGDIERRIGVRLEWRKRRFTRGPQARP